jgi:hypothetical protein
VPEYNNLHSKQPSHLASVMEMRCFVRQKLHVCTDVRRLTTGIRSERCVVRRFRRCANVIVCTYTNLDSIAHYIPMLYGIAYCS